MADIPVTITIPEEFIQTMRDMLISNGNVEITLSRVRGLGGSYSFTFLPRQEGEGEIAWVKRFIRQNLMSYLRLKAQNDKIAQTKQAVQNLPEIPLAEVDEGSII